MEQKPLPSKGCFAWHPLRHAAMVAIENAAERDRMMFPSSTSITKPDSNGNLENYNEPAKRLKTDTKVSLIACWHKILIAITYLLFYETSNDPLLFFLT
jgi:tRNA-specific adenosine deaminase 3